MGANTFEDIYRGDATAQLAYSQLCQDARVEHGSSYTGSIAETSGFEVVTTAPVTLDEADVLIEQLRDSRFGDKWGPCGAIELCHESPAQWDEVTEHKVRFTAPAAATQERLRALAVKGAGVKMKDVKDVYGLHPRAIADRRVTATATSGKSLTRYFVVTPGAPIGPRWEAGFDSQAGARAAAVTAAQDAHYACDFDVVAVTRRVDGSPLVQVRTRVKRNAFEATVLTGRLVVDASVDRAQRSGWLFFGWAAS